MDIQISIDVDDRNSARRLAGSDVSDYGPDFSDAMTAAAFLAGLENHQRRNVLNLADRVVSLLLED